MWIACIILTLKMIVSGLSGVETRAICDIRIFHLYE
jgi:hypothetical protein